MTTRRQRDKMKLRSSDNYLQTVTRILGTGYLVQTAKLQIVLCVPPAVTSLAVVTRTMKRRYQLFSQYILMPGVCSVSIEAVCVRAAGEAPPHCRGQLLQPPLRLCTHHTLHWARLRAGRAPRHRQLRGGGGETGPSPHIAPGYIFYPDTLSPNR